MNIIDFHTHAFPDDLAERAMTALQDSCDVKAVLDGTIASLITSMDASGIAASVIASIATRPKQFDPIMQWSKQIASDRIIPFISVHPDDPEAVPRIRAIKDAGFKGIKLHPYYQGFVLDDERMFPIYEALIANDLILLSHTGFDIAFPHDRICDPEKIARVMRMFPQLKLVTSHLGAWYDWDEVEKHILGKPIYMELSFSLQVLTSEQSRHMLEAHPQEYLLFGTDSPWTSQPDTLQLLQALNLSQERLDAILARNAARLLNLSL